MKKIILNLFFIIITTCHIIKRGTGNISDFKKYDGIPELIKSATANYTTNFKYTFKDGPIYTGDGTAYGSATSGGNCLFPKNEYYKDMMYAAINKEQYNSDMGCGLCALVVSTDNPYAPIRVRIIDQCPECAHGSLDFSDKAYKALTNQDPGRVKITWALIPCDIQVNDYPPLVQSKSPIKFKFKSGTSEYWAEVQVFNTRYPVAKVELKNGDKYIKLARRDYNYWYRKGSNAGFGKEPFTFRVTMADSSVIIAEKVKMTVTGDEDNKYSTGEQKDSIDDSSNGPPLLLVTVLPILLTLLIIFLVVRMFGPKLQKYLQKIKPLPSLPSTLKQQQQQ